MSINGNLEDLPFVDVIQLLHVARKSGTLVLEGPNGNAAICIKCGKCLEKCPQQINIPDELEKVNAILGKRAKIADHYQ